MSLHLHAGRLTLITAALLALASSCTKSEPELRQDDRASLELIIAEDVRASNAMAEADKAAREKNVAAALDAVDKRARPAIEAGLKLATTGGGGGGGGGAEQKSQWGRSKRDVLAKILTDRKNELGPYTEAIKSDDPQKMLDSIEAQAKIERRALAAVADVRGGEATPANK